MGGGKLGPQIIERFVSLAGGTNAQFVVIPTAGEDTQIDLADTQKKFMGRFGVSHVAVLHTRNRSTADTVEFFAPLRSANGVWFEGGRQWRLADAYLGTSTEREIKAVLDRGGVIGGTSAGATIQGSYLVRGALEGNTVMMAPGHEQGFGLMKNVAIDQHLLTRRREKDLVGVIAAHPELLGVGIDEGTAIVVHGDRFDVIGSSKVAIYDGREHGVKDRNRGEGNKFFFLSPGDTFDLRQR